MLDPARRQFLGWAAAGLVVVLGGAWFVHGAGSGSAASSPVAARPAASGSGSGSGSGEGLAVERTADSQVVVVHVAGWVRRPGVYRLRTGARVQEAVRRAGGARHGADLDALNLAAKLTDGRQVIVTRKMVVAAGGGTVAGGGAATPGTPGAPSAPAAPVSLNSATADELGTLDGVGPATAAKIIDYREEHGGFGSVDELDQVPGIGPKKLAALREHVTT